MLTFFKRIIKYFYFHFIIKKKVSIHFHTHLDFKSKFGIGCKMNRKSRVSDSKIGDNVLISEGAKIKVSVLGNNVKIYDHTVVVFSRIGNNSYLSRNTSVHKLTMGKYCSVGQDVLIGIGIHPTNYLSTSPIFYAVTKYNTFQTYSNIQFFEEYKEVVIGNDVWIGTRVMILDGVTIGNGAIVAANSVVTKNVEPYSIVGGTPAKHIKYRFSAQKINEIQDMNWWDWPEEKIKESIDLFQKEIHE